MTMTMTVTSSSSSSSSSHPSTTATSGSSSSSSSKRQRRHVFLFRHCIRSLLDTIDFHDNDAAVVVGDDAAAVDNDEIDNNTQQQQQQQMHNHSNDYFSTNPYDYLPHWPEWNTPPKWCTAVGTDIMKGTGKFLFQKYLHYGENNDRDDVEGVTRRHYRRVKFISDTTPRDVQTALAIMSGISEEEDQLQLSLLQQQQHHHHHQKHNNNNNKCQTMQQYENDDDDDDDDEYPPLQGLHNIQLDSKLFHHFDDEIEAQSQQEDICNRPPRDDYIRAIAERLQSIPPPGELVDIMEWMERTTGKKDLFQTFFLGDTGNKKSRDERNQFILTPRGNYFQGAPNLVKYISQAITYSRASGIAFKDWIGINNGTIDITTADYYNLMAWEHWSRHITCVGNNLAAAQGGIMMVRILQELGIDTPNVDDVEEEEDDDNEGYVDKDVQEEEEEEEEDIVATFIIGHDGDIDGVATALGISWNLPPPYHPGYTPTPPGSAIHFEYDSKDGQIKISVMAPMFFSDREGGGGMNALNTSGVLVEVPAEFVSTKALGGGESTSVVNAAVFPSLDALRNHTLNTLQGFSGSVECFEAVEKSSAPDLLLLPHPHGDTTPDHTGSTILLIGGLIAVALLVILIQSVHRERYQTVKQHRESSRGYAGVSRPKDRELV